MARRRAGPAGGSTGDQSRQPLTACLDRRCAAQHAVRAGCRGAAPCANRRTGLRGFACALGAESLFITAAEWGGMTEAEMVNPGSGQIPHHRDRRAGNRRAVTLFGHVAGIAAAHRSATPSRPDHRAPTLAHHFAARSRLADCPGSHHCGRTAPDGALCAGLLAGTGHQVVARHASGLLREPGMMAVTGGAPAGSSFMTNPDHRRRHLHPSLRSRPE